VAGVRAAGLPVTDTGHGLTGSAAEAAYAAFVIGAGVSVRAPIAVSQDLGDPSASAGHGMRGMRERAAAASGTIDIGPLPEGGFRVAATLPLDARAAANTTVTAIEKGERAIR